MSKKVMKVILLFLDLIIMDSVFKYEIVTLLQMHLVLKFKMKCVRLYMWWNTCIRLPGNLMLCSVCIRVNALNNLRRYAIKNINSC